jgi:hypothetical protein
MTADSKVDPDFLAPQCAVCGEQSGATSAAGERLCERHAWQEPLGTVQWDHPQGRWGEPEPPVSPEPPDGYLTHAMNVLRAKLLELGCPDQSGALLRVYTLLVLVTGPATTRQHVHDAVLLAGEGSLGGIERQVWDLPPDQRDVYDPYVQAIRKAAWKLQSERNGT